MMSGQRREAWISKGGERQFARAEDVLFPDLLGKVLSVEILAKPLGDTREDQCDTPKQEFVMKFQKRTPRRVIH